MNTRPIAAGQKQDFVKFMPPLQTLGEAWRPGGIAARVYTTASACETLFAGTRWPPKPAATIRALYSRLQPAELSRRPRTLSIDHQQWCDQNDVRDYCQDIGFLGR